MADLMTAKKDAAARSLESKKVIFIAQLDTGECELVDKQSDICLHAFKDGNEIPLPSLPTEKLAKVKVTKALPTKTKSKKKMAKEVKTPAKKAAPAKKVAGEKLIGRATTVALSKENWAKVDKAVDAGKGSIRELASKGILKAL